VQERKKFYVTFPKRSKSAISLIMLIEESTLSLTNSLPVSFGNVLSSQALSNITQKGKGQYLP